MLICATALLISLPEPDFGLPILMHNMKMIDQTHDSSRAFLGAQLIRVFVIGQTTDVSCFPINFTAMTKRRSHI